MQQKKLQYDITKAGKIKQEITQAEQKQQRPQ